MTLRFNRSTGGNTEALGRSRGGFGSKIVGVCEAAGRLVDFVLVPGHAHELVLLRLFAAGGTRYKPCHDETTTSGSGAAGSALQGPAVHL
jgi:hypothetical protein